MIPYFSIINTPNQVIVTVLFLAFCASISLLGYLMCCDAVGAFEDMRWYKGLLASIAGVMFCIFLTWILIGDSTSWSEPIGLWLRGRRM